VRKLLLAEGLARRPWAVVLDEPTNHVDPRPSSGWVQPWRRTRVR
jgi:ATPase subunit of ABC transporter with duplicated ATPase domains